MAFNYQSFSGLEPNSVGDFLAGLFAPLAFLWLVVGLLQQGQELKLQYFELKKSVDQYTEQSDALRGAEKHAKQSVLNETRKIIERDLSVLAARMVYTITSTSAGRKTTRSDASTIWWDKFNNGDTQAVVKSVYIMLDNRNQVEDEEVVGLYPNLFHHSLTQLKELGADETLIKVHELSYFGSLAMLIEDKFSDMVKAQQE